MGGHVPTALPTPAKLTHRHASLGRPPAQLVVAAVVAFYLARDDAKAATLEATVATGGGYDTNALLEIRPENTGVRARGAFVGLEPDVTLTLSRGDWRLYARGASTLRQSPQFGFVAWNTLDVGAAYLRHTTHLAAGVSANHFAASKFGDESLTGVGPQLIASTAVSERFRLFANVLSQWRSTQGTTQRLDAAALALRFSAASHLQVGARASWMSLASTASSFDQPWRRLRLGPHVQADGFAGRIQVQASPFVGLRQLEGNQAQQLGVLATIEARLAAGFGLLARLDWTQEGGPTAAGRGDRTEVWLALTWQTTAGQTLPGAMRAALPAADYAPLMLRGRVRFRLRAPAAKSVLLQGSFNQWGHGVALNPGADGIWETWITLPPGRVRYHFMVDDVPLKPPHSPRYVADGFGGVDGEIDVAPPLSRKPDVSHSEPESL